MNFSTSSAKWTVVTHKDFHDFTVKHLLKISLHIVFVYVHFSYVHHFAVLMPQKEVR